MTEPSDVTTTRAAYDIVAADYTELLRDELAVKPFDRAMLASFAESVGSGTIADIGCGPGRVTAHLDSLGLAAFGIDLSPGMVAIARREHPSLRFEEGSMEALDEHDISLDAYRLSPDRVGEVMWAAGLEVIARLVREPDESERTPQAFMIGRRRGRG